ncbi:MAG: hypothetical protein JJU34_21015 [Lunatimonas sp.]|uniref:hypothetical protein n=1 Tax=Lunatimonas sp. TaxID=2060141 RepID=UPI00263A67FC|nr:hypothetical protein [Lunatimonas sp.]MCC5939776.1 hypothetical protein [Lunatimonas sp.]
MVYSINFLNDVAVGIDLLLIAELIKVIAYLYGEAFLFYPVFFIAVDGNLGRYLGLGGLDGIQRGECVIEGIFLHDGIHLYLIYQT